MNFELKLPNFQVETPSERRMYAYLYQTVQQLNWAMKHLDGGEAAAVYEAGLPASGQEKPQAVGSLKDLILKTADVVEAVTMQVTGQLKGRYVAKSEFGTFQEDTRLTIEATDKRITQNYENIQLITAQVDSLTETNAYIRTGLIGEDEEGLPVYGLEIGQTGQVDGEAVFHKFARFSSSRLSFFDRNDTEIAYISDYKLYITNAHITGSLTLGDFELDTTDGLAFRWMGGA